MFNNYFPSNYYPSEKDFIDAIKRDDVERVSQCLENHPSLMRVSNAPGKPLPIHIAAINGSINVLKLFASQNRDFGIFSFDKQSPLKLAAAFGELEAMKFIVKTIAKQTNRPLDVIIDETLDTNTALHDACSSGTHIQSLEVVKYLIKNNAAINAKNCHGNTALHNACKSGLLNTVIYLLDKGAEVDEQNIDGDTPLLIAIKEGFDKVATTLFLHKANVHRFNINSEYPLGLMKESSYRDSLILLTKHMKNKGLLNDIGNSNIIIGNRR